MTDGSAIFEDAPEDLDMDGLTDDAFLGGRLRILQPKKGYRAGIDAVFLAAAVPARPGDRVFEAGTGVATASMCLARRVRDLSIAGVELQREMAMLARHNAGRNAAADRFTVFEGDIAEAKQLGLPPHGFDHLMANPPYFEAGRIASPQNGSRAQAHVFEAEGLAAWVGALHWLAKPKASVTFVHRAEALADLVSLMHGRFGDIRLFPLWPSEGEAARRILVQGRKGTKGALKLLPGMVLHRSDGGFTEGAEAVLREGERLALE